MLFSFPVIATDRIPLNSEIKAVIRDVRVKKATGPDEKEPIVVKVNFGPLVDIYHKINTVFWEVCHFSTPQYEATIVSIHKKSSKAACNNH